MSHRWRGSRAGEKPRYAEFDANSAASSTRQPARGRGWWRSAAARDQVVARRQHQPVPSSGSRISTIWSGNLRPQHARRPEQFVRQATSVQRLQRGVHAGERRARAGGGARDRLPARAAVELTLWSPLKKVPLLRGTKTFVYAGPEAAKPARPKLTKFFCYFLFTKSSAFFALPIPAISPRSPWWNDPAAAQPGPRFRPSFRLRWRRPLFRACSPRL